VDKRPLRVGLVFLSAALALAAVLLTGCGGSDDRAKVEASLRHYLIHPHACINYRFCPEGAFPVGAGAPQVKENSCRKIHTGLKDNGEVSWAAPTSRQKPLPPATVYEGGP
jgi:hypothetical protein